MILTLCRRNICYAVVQFTEWKSGTSILAVPESWLIDKGKRLLCYFTKSNAQKLIEQQAVARGDWKMYPVRRQSVKSISNYDTALRKESEARFTSGVDTDREADDEHLKVPKAVKRKSSQPVLTGIENMKSAGLFLSYHIVFSLKCT